MSSSLFNGKLSSVDDSPSGTPTSELTSSDEVNHRIFRANSEDDLTASFNSTHFSTTEEKLLKEQDLKFRALQLDDDVNSEFRMKNQSPVKRRPSIIDLPYSHIPNNGINAELTLADSLDPSKKSNQNSLLNQYASGELIQLFKSVQVCLDLRHKYMDISYQRFEMDNPKNKNDWVIYPPPPEPTYKSKNKFNQSGDKDHKAQEEFEFDKCPIPGPTNEYTFDFNSDGNYQVYVREPHKPIIRVPSLNEFYSDLSTINKYCSDGPSKSFAYKRLEYLGKKWDLYYLLNEFEENKQSKRNPHRDFYNVRKVDTHIHHSACMNQKHLLRFIKYKLKTEPNQQVIFRNGKILTLSEVFKSLNLTAYDLSIDTLDMHAHTDTFHRFDKFNLKYNPIGESRLREIFLKTDNFINGSYLAELTKQVIDDLEGSKYQMNELRVSIYGRSIDEWDKLASWVIDNKIISHNVRWLIQVPRLYDLYKKNGNVHTFKCIVINLFQPLYEVTINPESHPKLHVFLQRVVGFDSVDDESKSEKTLESRKYPNAENWDFSTNPPYSYYLYYLFANMAPLNQLRAKLGYNTFVLRPHSGEAGDPDHLMSAFLTSYGISHGIRLRKLPFVQYLFYLDQIGMAMSPLSNNALFLTYDKNPFYEFFKKGMNVSLSTDDPLQFSYTKEPLIEEYSVAAQIYKLSSVDMCEMASNSVRQSGYEASIKRHWLGPSFDKGGIEGNNVEKSNVPVIRARYREETLKSELELVKHYSSCKAIDY